MATSRADSISLSELDNRVQKAVASVVGGVDRLDPGKVRAGFFPHPGIFGFILSRDQIEALGKEELGRMAAGAAEQIGVDRSGLGPVVLIHDHGGTMGFFPREDAEFLARSG